MGTIADHGLLNRGFPSIDEIPHLALLATHRGRILLTAVVCLTPFRLFLFSAHSPSSSRFQPLFSDSSFHSLCAFLSPKSGTMFFSKSLVAVAALCLSLSLQVHAHAAIAPALGVQGTPVRSDVQRPTKARPCGRINIAQNIDSSTAVTAAADGSFDTTITNFNAYASCLTYPWLSANLSGSVRRGRDGSTQVTAQVDATGTGESFVDAQVLKNGVEVCVCSLLNVHIHPSDNVTCTVAPHLNRLGTAIRPNARWDDMFRWRNWGQVPCLLQDRRQLW